MASGSLAPPWGGLVRVQGGVVTCQCGAQIQSEMYMVAPPPVILAPPPRPPPDSPGRSRGRSPSHRRHCPRSRSPRRSPSHRRVIRSPRSHRSPRSRGQRSVTRARDSTGTGLRTVGKGGGKSNEDHMKVRFERLKVRSTVEWVAASHEHGAFDRENHSCWICSQDTKKVYPMLPVLACGHCWGTCQNVAPDVYNVWCKAFDDFSEDNHVWRKRR